MVMGIGSIDLGQISGKWSKMTLLCLYNFLLQATSAASTIATIELSLVRF